MVWVAVMLPLFLAVAGLVIDAGQVFDARREAQNVADGAARVAAMQLDVTQLRATGQVQLNVADARTAAERYVRDQAHGAGWDPPSVTGNPNSVQVSIGRQVPTSFLRIVNVMSLAHVVATARAEPCVGITTGARAGGGQC